MLKIATFYVDTADMKKLDRIAKKDGLKASYLVRKAVKEFIERKEREEHQDRIAKQNKPKASYLVRKAVQEFIDRKEQENNVDWLRDFVEEPDPPVSRKKKS